MTARAEISVIVPVFNGEAFVAEAIQSILDQSLQPAEIIVIDDGSTDNSAGILRDFDSIAGNLQYLYQKNRGVTQARNRGIEASTGELIAFLDQDDLWASDALATHYAHHRQVPETGYSLAQQVCFLEAMAEPPAWFRLQKLDVAHTGFLPGTLMVKRRVFSEIGVFDPQYPISSDADWFARARDAGIPSVVLPRVLLRRRIHAGNQSRHGGQIHSELTHLLRASIKRKREGG